MSSIAHMISGFNSYKATILEQQNDAFSHLIEQGQKPSTMVITCSDMWVSPDQIVSANPGDLYVVRNMAGLVPPYDNKGVHSAVAAIEYAVCTLEVENIVILGHEHCHATKMLLERNDITKNSDDPIAVWLSIAEEAKASVNEHLKDKDMHEKMHICGQEMIVQSLKNLMSYPWIEERLDNAKLSIHGWHFNISKRELLGLDMETGYFEPLG